MKKNIILFILIFSILLSFIFGFFVKKYMDDKRINKLKAEQIRLKNEYKFIKELNEQLLNSNAIEKRERECIERSISTDDSIKCTYIAEQEWDNEISRYLELLKKSMTTKEYKLIENNYKIWQKQNQSDNEIIKNFIFNHGGTMYYQLAASDYSELKKQRAEFFKWIYNVYTDNIPNSSK